MRAFRLHVDRHGDVAAVACVGELDMAEVDSFEDELRRLEDGGPSSLVIDLSELTLIDSHGLSALLDADARCRDWLGREVDDLGRAEVVAVGHGAVLRAAVIGISC